MLNRSSLADLLKNSEELSNKLSNFTATSTTNLNNIYSGIHNTKTVGRGESFLQFREFRQGDDIKNIDWRKSASTNKKLVREKEKELSDVMYIHVDNSSSMLFKSTNKLHDKHFISCLAALTLCRVFSRYREQVFLFNENKIPVKCSSNINNFNNRFLKIIKEHILPNTTSFKKNSFCIFISDFFFKKEKLLHLLSQLKKKSITGLLLQVLDPLELEFKVDNNIRLVDMETNQKVLLNNSLSLEKAYRLNLQKLKLDLTEVCEENNFVYMQYSTESSLNNFLLKIIKNILINKEQID